MAHVFYRAEINVNYLTLLSLWRGCDRQHKLDKKVHESVTTCDRVAAWNETHLFVLQPSLFQVEVMQVVDEECVFDGFEDDPDVLRVCGAGEVCVKGFVALTVVLLEHLQDELLRWFGVALRPCGGESGQSQREPVVLRGSQFWEFTSDVGLSLKSPLFTSLDITGHSIVSLNWAVKRHFRCTSRTTLLNEHGNKTADSNVGALYGEQEATSDTTMNAISHVQNIRR